MRTDKQTKDAIMGLYDRSIVHIFSEHTPKYWEPWIKVLDNKMTVFFRNRNNGKPHEPTPEQLINLQNHTYTGKIGKGSQSKLRQVLDTWINGMLANGKEKFNVRGSKKYSPVFITLTLPAEQFHADLFVKRHILGNFLKIIQQQHGVICYFWRAESQQNGNIHFHVIIDKFIKKEVLSNIWERTMIKHGYMQKFREKNGNKVAPSVNVKGINDVKNFVEYVLKYAFKDEEHRLISGRVWGMSDRLRTVKAFERQMDTELMADFRTYYDNIENKKYVDEFYAVVYVKGG